jgi:predicted RNA-binding protein with PUA-like domain
MPAKTAHAGLLFLKRLRGFVRSRFLWAHAFCAHRVFRISKRVAMRYWLMKSEPDEVSYDDVMKAPERTVAWFGVRNYQARNFLRDAMQVGDGVLFYHSSCAVPGVAGIAEVASTPYPDASQFDRHSRYFDPKASAEQPRWISVDVRALQSGHDVPRFLSLSDMRAMPELADMVLLQKGSRLSISPVTVAEWQAIVARIGGDTPAPAKGR